MDCTARSCRCCPLTKAIRHEQRIHLLPMRESTIHRSMVLHQPALMSSRQESCPESAMFHSLFRQLRKVRFRVLP